MKFENEEAVSPVIGVILMVAITVILAAVIAAFVFGMAGSTSSQKQVAVVVTLNGTPSHAVATWQGGADLTKIQSWQHSENSGTSYTSVAATPAVGQVNDLGAIAAGARCIITAQFSDGATQVIFDKQF